MVNSCNTCNHETIQCLCMYGGCLVAPWELFLKMINILISETRTETVEMIGWTKGTGWQEYSGLERRVYSEPSLENKLEGRW